MHRARFLVVVLVAFLAMTAIIVVRALMPAEDGAMMRGERVMAVAVAGVPEVEFADIVEALGTARANETVTITARVTDTISRINFESGQQVEAGAILVELTDTEEAAGLAEARTTLREAQRDLTRATDLVARAVVPQSRLDEATAVVELLHELRLAALLLPAALDPTPPRDLLLPRLLGLGVRRLRAHPRLV